MKAENFAGPVNIGSEEMVTINDLAKMVSNIANKSLKLKHISGPIGVRGRNSSNELIRAKLGWNYEMSLDEGLAETYNWIKRQIENR